MPLGERRHPSLLTLAVGLALVGGLAACTSGEGAEPGPTESSASAAPTAEPSGEPTADRPEVEKPVPPDAMARDDVAGAEAAAQYFLELYPYVYATGDLSEWKAMSDPECVFCKDVFDDVGALHAAGGYQDGGSFTITRVASQPPEDGSQYFAVWIDAEEDAVRRLSDDGSQIGSSTGGPIEVDMAVYRAEQGWLVRGVETFDPSGS
ncbi:DUF6318 family protein [Georgenia soli]|uniref:DUF6318 family protein n=1 Tax=Georgenia soli TaxID=638953 RepID=UPI00117BCD8C|nr:DUF6318 family protein [Georgenia soli]